MAWGEVAVLRPEALAHPLTPVLRQVEASSCPGRFNFHCHTIHSDGSLDPADLAMQACSLGLEHLAITDHHCHRALEGALESGRLGDVDLAALDQRVHRSAARAGEQADLLARVRELLGDGRADGAGSGDDVDLVHLCS